MYVFETINQQNDNLSNKIKVNIKDIIWFDSKHLNIRIFFLL